MWSTRRIFTANASRRMSLEASARSERRSSPARILSALLLYSPWACTLPQDVCFCSLSSSLQGQGLQEGGGFDEDFPPPIQVRSHYRGLSRPHACVGW